MDEITARVIRLLQVGAVEVVRIDPASNGEIAVHVRLHPDVARLAELLADASLAMLLDL